MFDFASEYFVSNATGIASKSGHGQFIFNESTDQLLWDADGTGGKAASVVIAFANDANLRATDFDLI